MKRMWGSFIGSIDEIKDKRWSYFHGRIASLLEALVRAVFDAVNHNGIVSLSAKYIIH